MKILYFGVLSEISGKTEENIDFTGTISQLQSRLNEMYPDINKQRFQISVNQHIVDNTHSINQGDEIALLPPFTGG
ncbi:MAG: MoaD/ThiS family protein [Bacteroidales bacterium]|nr:MoaD/ThiS family protein [Bacteroidales bacterium]